MNLVLAWKAKAKEWRKDWGVRADQCIATEEKLAETERRLGRAKMRACAAILALESNLNTEAGRAAALRQLRAIATESEVA